MVSIIVNVQVTALVRQSQVTLPFLWVSLDVFLKSTAQNFQSEFNIMFNRTRHTYQPSRDYPGIRTLIPASRHEVRKSRFFTLARAYRAVAEPRLPVPPS